MTVVGLPRIAAARAPGAWVAYLYDGDGGHTATLRRRPGDNPEEEAAVLNDRANQRGFHFVIYDGDTGDRIGG